jgi:predicted nucleotidyltransferase
MARRKDHGKTASGKQITDDLIDEMAAKAEVGYDVEETPRRMPPLDRAALERLTKALDREGVVAAMLIEAQAREKSDPLSDVDIAIWHDPELEPAAAQELQVRLVEEASHAIGVKEVNLVMLNHASQLMRYSAIRDGKRLIERDHDERVRLETRAILDYLDTAPLRELASGS